MLDQKRLVGGIKVNGRKKPFLVVDPFCVADVVFPTVFEIFVRRLFEAELPLQLPFNLYLEKITASGWFLKMECRGPRQMCTTPPRMRLVLPWLSAQIRAFGQGAGKNNDAAG